jgi:hypothetical protein
VTTAAVLRDAGPVVAPQSPGSDALVAAEVVDVLGSEGLVPLEVAVPSFDMPSSASWADRLLGFCRLPGFCRFAGGPLVAGPKLGGGKCGKGEGSGADTASIGAGGTRRTATRQGGAPVLAWGFGRARGGGLGSVVIASASSRTRLPLDGPRLAREGSR